MADRSGHQDLRAEDEWDDSGDNHSIKPPKYSSVGGNTKGGETFPGAHEERRASLIAQLVKNPPAMWETWVRFLGWEDLLEKGKATHSNILVWRIA